VPIIAMTAHAMAGDEQKSLQAGMNGHVTKPIDPDQLFSALLKWIRPSEKRARTQPSQVPAARSEAEKMAPVEDDLPESLPGFDISAGLTRLMGNKRLYRKLLVDFGTKYTEVAGEIRLTIDAKDFEQAHSLVHNLKGLAGNLEAKELQAATVEMEKLVKGQTAKTVNDKALNHKFAVLQEALEQALAAVQILVPRDDKKTIDSHEGAAASVPLDLIKKVAESISAAAEMGDVAQIKSIAEELKSESDPVAPFCDELIRLADDFDLDGIQKMMIELDS
jgi:HPt (histidine-containing phosphotransfer) domain-containing protein